MRDEVAPVPAMPASTTAAPVSTMAPASAPEQDSPAPNNAETSVMPSKPARAACLPSKVVSGSFRAIYGGNHANALSHRMDPRATPPMRTTRTMRRMTRTNRRKTALRPLQHFARLRACACHRMTMMMMRRSRSRLQGPLHLQSLRWLDLRCLCARGKP